MALSSTEKAQAIRVLGWPAKTLTEGTTGYSKVISDRLIGLSDEAEGQARALLSRIGLIDGILDSALTRLAAKRVGDIETNPEEIAALKSERRRTIRELSQTLDIELIGAGGGLNMSVVV